MSIQDAISKAVREHPDKLQAWKRDKRMRGVATRIEEHAYGRASNVQGRKKK